MKMVEQQQFHMFQPISQLFIYFPIDEHLS